MSTQGAERVEAPKATEAQATNIAVQINQADSKQLNQVTRRNQRN